MVRDSIGKLVKYILLIKGILAINWLKKYSIVQVSLIKQRYDDLNIKIVGSTKHI